MATGINGQKTYVLRADEKYDATWHHWAGKGYEKLNLKIPDIFHLILNCTRLLLMSVEMLAEARQ
jgi:hypothetical protein